MAQELAHEFATGDTAFLSTLAISVREKRLALAVIGVSLLLFALVAPYAKLPLTKVWAFIPTYESALVINDLITAALLFGQFRILGSRSLCMLACGYIFTASTTVIHALTFPELFAPTGLLGAGPQTTAWLYMFWHGGFPLFVIAYACLKGKDGQWRASDKRPINALACVAATLAVVTLFALLATRGQRALPAIMQGSHYTPILLGVITGVWALSVLALIVLYRRRPHAVLDLWLGVVMCAWLLDIALSAMLNAGRFDLGFYAGRIYGLFAASGVLLVLLLENERLHAQLVNAHRREHDRSLELAALNKELEAFSYSVSHDLRAPLRAIDGFSKALANHLGAEKSEKVHHYLDRISTAARRMGVLIDDLIDLSRVTRLPLRPTQVDVTQMSKEILANLQDSEPDRKVETCVGQALQVNADPHLLAIVLENLLGNAWKYTSRRSHPVIEVGMNRVNGAQVFFVKDNGAGFDMNHASNLFTAFHRLHSDTEFPGSGIGLATVHRIVSRHCGKIWAEAAPDRGATFHFLLERNS